MPSKRRRASQPTPPPTPAASSSAGGWRVWAAGAVALILIGLVAAAAVAQGWRTPAATAQPGPVTSCRTVPRFAGASGYRSVSFATDDRSMMGLIMTDPSSPGKVFRDPTWDDAGWLGPVIADGQGNVYVAPVPRINLIDNPPERQNRIYRVDTNTGTMALYAELPAAAAPSPENPYGVLGLALDCETNSLYATSVSGSTHAEERGRIFRIDLSTGKVAAQYDGVDSIGVAVYNTARGKRLFFGLARASEVRSVALDAKGDFAGDERAEVRLRAPGASGTDRARRIAFTDKGEMQVNGRQFDYNLVASTFQPKLLYTFRYSSAKEAWELTGYEP